MKPTTPQRPTQPKKNWVKSGIWATFSHSNFFSWVGINFLYRKQTARNPTQPKFSAYTLFRLVRVIESNWIQSNRRRREWIGVEERCGCLVALFVTRGRLGRLPRSDNFLKRTALWRIRRVYTHPLVVKSTRTLGHESPLPLPSPTRPQLPVLPRVFAGLVWVATLVEAPRSCLLYTSDAADE